jgi:hypothetical protein
LRVETISVVSTLNVKKMQVFRLSIIACAELA